MRGLDRKDFEVRCLEPLTRERVPGEGKEALDAELPQGSGERQAAPDVAEPDLGPRVGADGDTRRGSHRRKWASTLSTARTTSSTSVSVFAGNIGRLRWRSQAPSPSGPTPRR